MIIFGWPIKVNWFLIFSQNIFNQSARQCVVSCMIRSFSCHGGLFVAYWPSMTGSWGDRDAECWPLIGWWPRLLTSDWSVMTSSMAPETASMFHHWPRRRPGPGPPHCRGTSYGQGEHNARLSLVRREAMQASDWLQRSHRVETSHLAHYWSCLDHGNQNTLRINFRPHHLILD